MYYFKNDNYRDDIKGLKCDFKEKHKIFKYMRGCTTLTRKEKKIQEKRWKEINQGPCEWLHFLNNLGPP